MDELYWEIFPCASIGSDVLDESDNDNDNTGFQPCARCRYVHKLCKKCLYLFSRRYPLQPPPISHCEDFEDEQDSKSIKHSPNKTDDSQEPPCTIQYPAATKSTEASQPFESNQEIGQFSHALSSKLRPLTFQLADTSLDFSDSDYTRDECTDTCTCHDCQRSPPEPLFPDPGDTDDDIFPLHHPGRKKTAVSMSTSYAYTIFATTRRQSWFAKKTPLRVLLEVYYDKTYADRTTLAVGLWMTRERPKWGARASYWVGEKMREITGFLEDVRMAKRYCS
jgi:hypothetical protein